MQPILILDAGGVIIDDIGIHAWKKIATLSQNPSLQQEYLYAEYKKDISEKLWTGQLDEQQLIDFLSTHQIFISIQQLRELIASCLTPLPAFHKVKAWATKMPVYIMSNHLTAWLMPALEPLKPYITKHYISDSYNVKKPTIDWFKLIDSKHSSSSSTIMFVDNTMHNIESAKQVGWNTIYADPSYEWIARLDSWIDDI